MALRSLTRSFQRNVDLAFSIAQTRTTAVCRPELSIIGNAGVTAAFQHQTRSIALSAPSPNIEKAIDDTGADFSSLESSSSSEVAASLIRNQVENLTTSLPLTERLFAVVQIDGQQYRVSQDDILTVEDWLIADAGERIRLEKVLLVGGREFSLIGRPLLRRTQVSVEATVIEKSLTATDIIRRFRQRSRFKKTWLTRKPITYLRINSIKLLSPE